MDRTEKDLAGEVCFCPSFFQTKARINYLIDEYFSCQQLCDRLKDLPQQFKNPQPRQWSKINWQDIQPEQVIGLDLDIFLSIIKDEINHLAKFWGMGMWLYPDGAEQSTVPCRKTTGLALTSLIRYLLSEIHTILPVSYESKRRSSIKSTFERMMLVLDWQSWSVSSKGELIYTFIWVLKRMWFWSSQLTPEYLHSCCATPSFFGNNSSSDRLKITIF